MKKAFLSLLIFLTLACVDNDENDDVSPSPPDPANNAATVPELQGTWAKPCASAGTEGGFSRNSISVQANNIQLQTLVFQNSPTCEGTADLDARAQFTFTVPSFASGQINAIDLIHQQLLAKFNTTQAVAFANVSAFCGFTDWQVGVDKNVAGRNCIANIPAAGQPFYQIFQVNPSQLFVGQIDSQTNGQTPETRPTKLESTPYNRQP